MDKQKGIIQRVYIDGLRGQSETDLYKLIEEKRSEIDQLLSYQNPEPPTHQSKKKEAQPA